MKISNRLEKHLAVAAAATVAAASNAAVVTWNCNLVIPANLDGLYINVETQASATSAAGAAGWDINPYGATGMNFFSSTGGGMVRLAATGGPSNLAIGYSVGASSPFSTATTNVFAAGSPSGWQLNAINYFGFRFNNGAGALLYGFGVMQVGASAATRTLLSVSYEDSGASITVVPAPGALALLGVAGLAGARRRR